MAILKTYFFHINHPEASCVNNWYLQVFGSKLLLFYLVRTLPNETWRQKLPFIFYCEMYVPYRLFSNSCFIFLHCNIVTKLTFTASYKLQKTQMWRWMIFSAKVSMFSTICDMHTNVCSLYHWRIYKLQHSLVFATDLKYKTRYFYFGRCAVFAEALRIAVIRCLPWSPVLYSKPRCLMSLTPRSNCFIRCVLEIPDFTIAQIIGNRVFWARN